MTPEIPAEAAEAQQRLPYSDYRRWWTVNVLRLPIPEPSEG